MKASKLLAALAALSLVLAACTEAADTTTTAGDGTEAPATTAADGEETTTSAAAGEGSTTTAAGAPAGDGRLAEVQARGSLLCGVNNTVPGFGFVDETGEHVGFDIDFCRAVAAGVLGDAEAVEFVDLTAEQRFTALQSGEVDVLIRNTTRTSSRDGGLGATFLTTTFYDGQGMMVGADGGFTAIDDMTDTTICVLSGTTTELNLTARMAEIPYTPLTFDENPQIQAAFIEGQCDGWTSDKSQLAGVRSAWPEDQGGPEALVILEETFSKEPLGPAVLDGDSQWAQAVDWIVLATMQAEEFGIDSTNVDTFTESTDTNIRNFLGLPVETDEGTAPFDPGLGLPTDFAAQVVTQVGNYAEIYDRNVGAGSPLGLERLLNELWTNGGLHYPPPYR
ncbi:MAG TPA: amino acid ABC transporter substrate-binding protein [Acidimicrobiia bacterium]|nr:amino acid ABC transporter substrate-binding protein [Acidimicrobiia bacterium]